MKNIFKLILLLLLVVSPLSEVLAQSAHADLINETTQVKLVTEELITLKDSLEKIYNISDKKNVILKEVLKTVTNFKQISKVIDGDTDNIDKKIEMLSIYKRSTITLMMLLKQLNELDLPSFIDYPKYKLASKKGYIISKDEYILSQSQINYELRFNSSIFRDYRKNDIARVVIEKDSTMVDLLTPISRENQGIVISENTFLRDKKSGVLYKIRRIKRNIPLAKLLVIPNSRGEHISFTLIFPPLAEDVKKLELITIKSNINPSSRYELQIERPLEFDLRLKSNNTLQMDKIIE